MATTSSKSSTPQLSFPYKWEEIAQRLSLTSTKEVPKLILSSSFLEPWITFRDTLPLQPDVTLSIQPKDKDAMNDLISRVYNMMDCMATARYDRPTSLDRTSWSATEFFECLVYQAARDLARESQPFNVPFQRQNLKNESGRNKALSRIRGLIYLVVNLTVNYTSMTPSNVIRRIEAIRPAQNPENSPLPDVRLKYRLDNMDVNELRKTVLDGERKGQTANEKEWLINIIMGKQALVPQGSGDVEVAIKAEGPCDGGKRAREEDEEREADERARTV